ncbi:MAG: TonB family protein [Desulfomonile tiedjei]|nr:TonB family protein [Desulfomonile tiedjei]
MKNLATAIILALALLSPAAAVDRTADTSDQMVVDRGTRDRTVNAYVLLTRDSIQRAWTTPVTMNVAGAVKGHVCVNYVVSRSGSLVSLELVEGSGNAEMDRTLLQAIKGAAPFPPFPDKVQARSLFIRAKFVVADVPTAPVTTAQHEVEPTVKPEPQLITPDNAEKQFKWGSPAASPGADAAISPQNEIPPRPAFTRYRWGLEK